jgi:hypothetical protein
MVMGTAVETETEMEMETEFQAGMARVMALVEQVVQGKEADRQHRDSGMTKRTHQRFEVGMTGILTGRRTYHKSQHGQGCCHMLIRVVKD